MEIPECPEILQKIMRMCWKHAPEERPEFKDILDMLREEIEIEEVTSEDIEDPAEYSVTNIVDYH
jgi:D-ribose pyranose/furanose isomerase RbsD